jgi:hypothetical protein
MDILSMSTKELNRLEVMQRLDKKQMSPKDASASLPLCRRQRRTPPLFPSQNKSRNVPAAGRGHFYLGEKGHFNFGLTANT